ncbi:MAG TPA: Lrp/AsnC family transcriptional regulator [Sphingobium sp.]|jgi:Lrp/AsnC family transcriptional regulator|nr:Lrp/AsnC family transcriptional regulator [Sphingobium sp.]
MDEFDRKILRVLQDEASVTMAELADRVGLSQTPCWRRVKALEESGVIERRAVLLSAEKLGFSVHVLAHIRLRQHDEETLDLFEDTVRAHPEIVECFVMSGEHDYIVRVLARSIDHYEQFLRKVLLHLPGVAHVDSGFALKKVKLTTYVPV